MSGAATIIITTIPPRRASVNALADECVALANDVIAEVASHDLTYLAAAVAANDWTGVSTALGALKIQRPYSQQS